MQLIGAHIVIWTASGGVPGVMSRKPIHLLTEEERKTVPKMKDLWIDIGADTKEDAEKVVRIGDSATFALKYQPLRNGLAASVAMDDKIGLWVVLEAFRRAVAAGPLPCSLSVSSTVQEEIGLRGAKTSCHRVDPHVAIAVDVPTRLTARPSIKKRKVISHLVDPLYIGDLTCIHRSSSGSFRQARKVIFPFSFQHLDERPRLMQMRYRLHVTVWQLALLASPIGTCIRL